MTDREKMISADQFAAELNELAGKWSETFPWEALKLNQIANDMRLLAVHIDDYLNDRK